jgi:transcriptional regulator with XRE-family HTH domain
MIQERLIKKRQESGLRQAELARIIGVGRDSYNKYERSGVKPSLEVLARIASALDTSTDYLLGSTDNPAPPVREPQGRTEAPVASYNVSPAGMGVGSAVAEDWQNVYYTGSQRAVIQLDNAELSLITDYRDIDQDSRNDLCRMAKMLAENARLKRMLEAGK